MITRSEKSLLVDVECTSLGDFVKAVKNQPRILHLSCHSDWNQESKVFNLFFENSKLELIRVSPASLVEMIGKNL